MTANETPAALLRRAADRLDEIAAATSRDRWEAVENYPGMWVVSAVKDQPPVPKKGVRNPHVPSYYVAEESSHGDLTPGDVHYIAAMGPQVAAPPAAWLRSTADDAQMVDDANEAARARATRTGGDGHTFLIQNPYVAHAAAFARSILGEEEAV